MPTPDAYWLALRRVRGVGPRTCRLLLERFGSPEQIFDAREAEIVAAGVPRPAARGISRRSTTSTPLEKELCELPRLGARLVRWTDADYPANLRQIADPPPYLFVRGACPAASSRHASRSSGHAPRARPGCGWRIGWGWSWPPRASPS